MQKKYLIILSTVVLSLCGAASLVYYDALLRAQLNLSGGNLHPAIADAGHYQKYKMSAGLPHPDAKNNYKA